MKLSIIIPVYRVEQTLNRCVQSVVSQTLNDTEVILVDDGSPDRCPQMCDEWAGRDERIHVIHRKNGGLSAARNAGIDIAQGEYVTFVDADDFVGTDTYPALLAYLERHPDTDILEYPVFWRYGAREQKVMDFGEKTYTDMEDYWLNGHAYEHSYACNKIYRLRLFNDVRFPEGRVFEDMATLPRLLQKASRVVTCQKGLYYYCWNATGITATAKGAELSMLLESHLRMMKAPTLLHNARYYMHVLNIQMDVCELCGVEPQLPLVRINPFAPGLDATKRTKALLLNIFGIRNLCKMSIFIHRLRNRS